MYYQICCRAHANTPVTCNIYLDDDVYTWGYTVVDCQDKIGAGVCRHLLLVYTSSEELDSIIKKQRMLCIISVHVYIII